MFSEQTPNICDNCPLAASLHAESEKLQSNTDGSMSEIKREMLANEFDTVAPNALNIAAGRVACRDKVKKIPEQPDPMPSVGSKELIGYIAQCPSFISYNEERLGNDGKKLPSVFRLAIFAAKLAYKIKR